MEELQLLMQTWEHLIPEHPQGTNAIPAPQNCVGKPQDSTIAPRDREELLMQEG